MWLPLLFDFNLQKPCRTVPSRLDRLNKKQKILYGFFRSGRRKKEFVIQSTILQGNKLIKVLQVAQKYGKKIQNALAFFIALLEKNATGSKSATAENLSSL